MRVGPIILGVLMMAAGLVAGLAVLMNPELSTDADPAFTQTTPVDWDDGTIRLDRYPVEEPVRDWLTEKDKLELSRHPEDADLIEDAPPKLYMTYKTRDSDTLPLIALRFLGNESLFSSILTHNPGAHRTGLRVPGGTILRIPLWLRIDPNEASPEPQLNEHGFEASIRSNESTPGRIPADPTRKR
jgi:hypothetical protein